jgi:hypothetical protein
MMAISNPDVTRVYVTNTSVEAGTGNENARAMLILGIKFCSRFLAKKNR